MEIHYLYQEVNVLFALVELLSEMFLRESRVVIQGKLFWMIIKITLIS